MANVRSSTGQTIVSVLNTFNSMATMVSKTVDSAASSVDMLDTFVQRAKVKQAEDNLVEDKFRRRSVMLDAAKEHQKLHAKVRKDYSNDPNGLDEFNEFLAELESDFAKFDAARAGN